jgi:hypothetical protein
MTIEYPASCRFQLRPDRCSGGPHRWGAITLLLTQCDHLLPRQSSSREQPVGKLLALGGRYHRYLHQDEFGPTRAERSAALRSFSTSLDALLRLMSEWRGRRPQLGGSKTGSREPSSGRGLISSTPHQPHRGRARRRLAGSGLEAIMTSLSRFSARPRRWAWRLRHQPSDLFPAGRLQIP